MTVRKKWSGLWGGRLEKEGRERERGTMGVNEDVEWEGCVCVCVCEKREGGK